MYFEVAIVTYGRSDGDIQHMAYTCTHTHARIHTRMRVFALRITSVDILHRTHDCLELLVLFIKCLPLLLKLRALPSQSVLRSKIKQETHLE